MPWPFSTPKVRPREGFLKSRSSSSVRAPDWARTTAVLMAVVDFPSLGNAELTRTTWGPKVGMRKEDGHAQGAVSCPHAGAEIRFLPEDVAKASPSSDRRINASLLLPPFPEKAGTMPSEGKPSSRSTSSGAFHRVVELIQQAIAR